MKKQKKKFNFEEFEKEAIKKTSLRIWIYW